MGGWLIYVPAPGYSALHRSLSASTQRTFPSLRRRRIGCSAAPQRRLLLPSPGGCPGGRLRRAPALRGRGLAQKDSVHVAGGKRAGPPSPAPPAASALTRSRGRGSPRRGRTKAAPGRMLLPDSPYAGRLQRARAGLCAAPASPLGVGARRRLSPRLLPFAVLPSSSACPTPALLAAPDSRRHLLRGWRRDPVQGGAARASSR